MNLKAVRKWTTIAALAALSGCQSGPRWAWWKHDSAPDSSAVARSAAPALPSAQTTPQAVAVAGLTPGAPPSSANLAAANPPAVGATAVPPSMSIPVTSSATVANAPQAAYPNAANALADKLTSSPNAMSKSATGALPTASLPTSPPGSVTSQPLTAASTPPSGPYDPKAYKPGSAVASSGLDPAGDTSSDVDRYGMSSAARSPLSTPLTASQPAATAPENHYGAMPSTTAPVAPAPTAMMPSSPLAQSPAGMSDRYGNPTTSPAPTNMMPTTPLPVAPSAPTTTASMSASPLSTPAAYPTPAVRSTASAAQYRPGGTSSYSAGATTPPVEIASRPSPVSSTTKPAVTPGVTPGAGSEPWTPSAPSAIPTATRTY
jgi:hypothetical protein